MRDELSLRALRCGIALRKVSAAAWTTTTSPRAPELQRPGRDVGSWGGRVFGPCGPIALRFFSNRAGSRFEAANQKFSRCQFLWRVTAPLLLCQCQRVSLLLCEVSMGLTRKCNLTVLLGERSRFGLFIRQHLFLSEDRYLFVPLKGGTYSDHSGIVTNKRPSKSISSRRKDYFLVLFISVFNSSTKERLIIVYNLPLFHKTLINLNKWQIGRSCLLTCDPLNWCAGPFCLLQLHLQTICK